MITQSITGPLTRPLTIATNAPVPFENHGRDVPYPAPVGYRWQVSLYDGVPETYLGSTLYYLERVV
jgi:hypothetical protein